MREIFKMIGSLVIISLFLGHLFLVGLIVAPSDRLLSLILADTSSFVSASDIPEDVVQFLYVNRVPVHANYVFDGSLKSKLIAGILEFRETQLMDESEVLALEMNLLDYGGGVVGLGSAASHYYGKDFAQLLPKEWITLVNLHEIFLKK